MPKLEPKIIQRELEQGLLWPVYWLSGTERMKSRELLKRIRRAVLGAEEPGVGLGQLAEEVFDGSSASISSILDSAQSLSLGGTQRFIVVRDAHALKEQELIAGLCGTRARKEELTSVCVFLSKDLDGRKKSSKMLIEKAAVVACDEVLESERDAWIGYLAKRRGMTLQAEHIPRLVALDPWSLDIVDQELEKFSLSQSSDSFLEEASGASTAHLSDDFLAAFFSRNLKASLRVIESFAEHPEESLPLLGLFAWNVRHLALTIAFKEGAGGNKEALRLSPHIADKLRHWSRHWSMAEVLELQSYLEDLDFSLKQTPLLPLGLWDSVALRFAR